LTCTLCGSSKHDDDNCRIAKKAELLRQGYSPEAAGFITVEINDVDKLLNAVGKVKK
jgi:hypothetical protein